MKKPSSSIFDKALSAILILVILSAIVAFTYNIASPPVTEKFTEFYILGDKGKAVDYPQNLQVGQETQVIVGIVNREYETASYRVEIRINGIHDSDLGPLTLEHTAQWQETVTFQMTAAGDTQRVEFLLYKSGHQEVYRSVYLLVNAR